MCLYALKTTSGLSPDKSVNSVLQDRLPNLDQGIRELLDSLWWYLKVLAAPITSHNFSIEFSSGE